MTFNRTLLIKVAQEALTQHERVETEHQQAVAAYQAKHAERYAETSRARARELRDALTKALKSPGPIHSKTVSHVTGSRYTDNFYNEPSDYDIKKHVEAPKGLLNPSEIAETRALVQVLQSATGDTVSANELKLLGLTKLQPVFVAAANAMSSNGEVKGK